MKAIFLWASFNRFHSQKTRVGFCTICFYFRRKIIFIYIQFKVSIKRFRKVTWFSREGSISRISNTEDSGGAISLYMILCVCVHSKSRFASWILNRSAKVRRVQNTAYSANPDFQKWGFAGFNSMMNKNLINNHVKFVKVIFF